MIIFPGTGRGSKMEVIDRPSVKQAWHYILLV